MRLFNICLMMAMLPFYALAADEITYPGLTGNIIIQSHGLMDWSEKDQSYLLSNNTKVFTTQAVIVPKLFIPGFSDILIFSESQGGNACAGEYRVAAFQPNKPPEISKPMGSCDVPTITYEPKMLLLSFQDMLCEFDDQGKLIKCQNKK